MKKRWIVLTVIILAFFFAVEIVSQSDQQFTEFKGKLKKIGEDWFLNTGEDFYKLNLAPDEFLVENKIELQAKQSIVIRGIIDSEEIVAYSLILDGSETDLRSKDGAPLWEESKKKDYYVVDKKNCIGCRLCIKPCPVDAIKMVNGIAVIDSNKCTSCGICVEGDNNKFKGCPVGAIKKAE